MKKLFLLFALACTLASVNAQAQVPNGSFENLNYDGTLGNWGNVYLFAVAIDSLGNQIADSIVFDNGYFYAPTSDAHSGSLAMVLSNAAHIIDTQTVVITGSASVDEDSIYTAWGSLEFIPLQTRPESLRFYYKFSPVNNDSAVARFAIYDSAGEVIGEANYLIIGAQNAYTLADVPVVYYSNNPVMAYSLNFSNFYSEIGDYRQANFGTRLWIDDVELMKSTAIQAAANISSVKMYPNPAKNSFLIDTKENVLSVSLVDAEGKEVLLSVGNDKKVNCGNVANGVYGVKVQTDKGILSGKLVIGE